MRKHSAYEVAFVPFANSINDTEGLFRLLDQITTVERFLFKDRQGTIRQKASDFLSANLVSIFAEIEERGLEPEGDSGQMQFLKGLATYLRDLPQVKVTMAFEPTNNFVAKLNSEISNVVGKKVILDMIINQYIIGGAIFEYNGRVSEQTLAGRLDEVIEDLIKKTPAGSKS